MFYTSVEKYGKRIYHVFYENGIRKTESVIYRPKLYVTSKNGEYETLYGEKVDVIEPGDILDTAEFIKKYSSHNFKIYGNTDYVASFINEHYPDGCTPSMSDMNISFLDIEVASDSGFPLPENAAHEVTAITLKNLNDSTFYTWGLGDYEATNENVVYCKCDDEHMLLEKFVSHWELNVPDIITGWNVEGFDLPYLFNRIDRMFDANMLKRLSMFKIPVRAEKNNFGDWNIKIYGTSCLDYLRLFRKFGYSYEQPENYKLDTIGELVVGQKKLDYSEYASLNELYLQDHQKFIDYNIKDVDLVERIEEKAGLIQLALTLAHKANSTYGSTFGSVRIWETYIYNVLRRMNIVMPNKPEHIVDRSIEGGYVKEPIKGMYKWVASFDLNSLYPHLILQYNMSSETIGPMFGGNSVKSILNGELTPPPENHCITPGGQTFSIENKGVFPQIIDDLYAQRVKIKDEMIEAQKKAERDKSVGKIIDRLNNEQMAIKILMNSLYGAMSNKYFRYFDANMAEAITLSGQLTIQWAEKHVNGYLQKVMGDNKDRIIAIDTDSIYVCLDDIVEKYKHNENDESCSAFLDQMAQEAIEPVLEKCFGKLAKTLNAYEQRMVMKREVIASKMIITGKKRYIANVLNNEGVQYAEPKMKITGIESVRSSTPTYCRKLIKDTLGIIMNEDEDTLQKHIASHRERFKHLRAEEVAFPRGAKEISKYTNGDHYTKGTPIHIRASILFNKQLKKKEVTNKYQKIYDGDKIKFLYLKMPNPINENVIGFPDILPEEFALSNYIDYDMQYDKSFVEPIKTICDAIGWTTEKQSTLEDFFT